MAYNSLIDEIEVMMWQAFRKLPKTFIA